MKKNGFIYLMLLVTCLMALPFVMTGCNEEEELAAPRLFKPKKLTAEAVYDGFVATWVGTEGAHGYKLEVSSNEDFATIDVVVETDGQTRTAELTKLQEEHLYYLRLCGTMEDETLNSKYIYAEVTTGIAYSIFLPVAEEKLSFRTAELEWRESVEADKITIEHTSGTSEVREQLLTEEDLASRSVFITGLSEGESYKVTMYAGEESLGIMRFTMPVKPEGTITIDVSNAASLQALIDEAPAGTTIMFTGEAVYDYSDEYIYIDKSLVLAGEPGVERPVLYAKGILLTGDEAATSIENVTLQRIEFSGMVWDGENEIITDKPATQLISADMKNVSELTMANLLVKDCVIRNYVNSFIDFVDAAPSQKIRIESLEVDNTQAFDLGRNNSDRASFISTTVKGNVLCRKYVIRNSTFHHLMRGLIEARVTGAIDNYSTPTVVIENCTFDEIGNMQPMIEGSWTGDNNGMTKPFLDFKGGALKPEIYDCVFGEMYTQKISNKFVQGATLVVDNSYMLTTSKGKLSGDSTVKALLDLGGTADSIFPDRDGYNYRISPDAGISNIGDPRWY